MKNHTVVDNAQRVDALEQAIGDRDLTQAAHLLSAMNTTEIIEVLERLRTRDRAVGFRLLDKDRSIEVFERLDSTLQSEVLSGLQDEDVAAVFAELDPDDRVALLDELPATVARRLMLGLSPDERNLTATVLGYPQGSIGRSMSPEFVTTHPKSTVASTLARVRELLDAAETIYTLPVTEHGRTLVGVISLRDLLRAQPDEVIGGLMSVPEWGFATADAEAAARHCADLKILALPIVDQENRLVGILTVDDALRILEDAESEDAARSGGTEPLRRPYLATPVAYIVRSRVVWLLVLALGATLTVQVLDVFEATLEQQVVLTLFIPLLIGTGGNTGNQAATTITRALSLGDVRPRDVFRVLAREVRVGITLGLLLGSLGFGITAALYSVPIGTVVGLTLLGVCIMAATVGGAMPLLGKAIKADPAVFSNPFITTFVDAAGLILYFFIAKLILGI